MAQSTGKLAVAEKVATKAGPEGKAATEVVKHAPKSVQKRAEKVVNITTKVGGPGSESPQVQKQPGPQKRQSPQKPSGMQKRAKSVQKHTRAALFAGAQYERAIKGEWLAGIALMWSYPIVKPDFAADFGKWIQRQIAWTAVFIVLLLIASVSDRWSKFCAAFGGLVLLALLVAPFGKGGLFGGSVATGVVGALTRSRSSGAAGPFGAVLGDTGDLGAPPGAPVGGTGRTGGGGGGTGFSGLTDAPDDGVGEMSSPGIGRAIGSFLSRLFGG